MGFLHEVETRAPCPWCHASQVQSPQPRAQSPDAVAEGKQTGAVLLEAGGGLGEEHGQSRAAHCRHTCGMKGWLNVSPNVEVTAEVVQPKSLVRYRSVMLTGCSRIGLWLRPYYNPQR